ncbi:hypothetical protein ACGFNF_17105 [Micromonospora sp. NPDC048868]|uniref:hypothetical protein n=1 Tax=Micromonospora sp. NPDC048868 TaxID=3364258 RepID=UPI0037214C33
MSDSTPPDLELIAQLIDDSSLGCREAFEAQNDIPLDSAMRLRGLTRQDVPDRQWDSLPESSTVLVSLISVVPNLDGSLPVDNPLPADRELLAVSRDGQCLELKPPRYCLPGGAHRQEWNILVAETGQAYRCKLEWLVPVPLENRGSVAIEAAIWWELAEPEEAARHQLNALSSDLIPIAARRLGYAGSEIPDSIGKQILFENALSQVLREHGISAECAVRVVRRDQCGQQQEPAGQQPESALPSEPTLSKVRSDDGPVPGAQARAVSPKEAAELPRDAEYIVNLMELLHREGGINYLPEYVSLLARGIRLRREAVGRLPGELDVRGAAYVLTLVDEALRIAGMQVDDARDRIVQWVSSVSLDRTLETTVEACAGCRAGQRGLPALVGMVVRMLLGVESEVPYRRTPFPRSRTADGLPLPLVGDMEARRQGRYEYDGQFA